MISAEESSFNEYCPPDLKRENDITYIKKYNIFMFRERLLDEKTILIDILDRMCGLRLPAKCCHSGAHYIGRVFQKCYIGGKTTSIENL